MRIEKKDASLEKRILTALITDSSVCGRISPHWKKGLFQSKWANLIGSWCISHFDKYGKSPGIQIQTRLEQWSLKNKDDSTLKLIESFLTGLSDDYEKSENHSSDYIVDLAAQYFNRTKTLRLSDALRQSIEDGDDKHAEDLLNEFSRVELGVGAGLDVLRDVEAIKAAFESTDADIVEYPEALGNFFKGALTRDAFVAFLAVMKKGKSFWLMDLAWRAMEQNRNVAFFQIGDMSQNQMMKRFMVRASRRPMKATRHGEIIRFPKSIEIPENSRRAVPSFKDRSFKHPLDWETAWNACQKIVGESSDVRLKLSCHPNGTVSIHNINSILETWERVDRWIPDCIVIDYADLLNPISKGDPIQQTDDTWRAMRALATTRHCLLVTATQANAAALVTELLGPQHFSGSKMKLAHITAMAGINQTHAEKKIQVNRLNWVEFRDSYFDTTMPVHVAGCLAIGNPAIKSIFHLE